MVTRILKLALPLLILLILPGIVGCEGEVSYTTASLSEATMARGVDDENKPVSPTTVFTPDTEEIFCSVKLSNAPADTEISSVWIYVGGEVEDLADYEIDSYLLTADGTRYLQFSMTKPDNDWPRGEYKLVLYVEGKESVTLPFSVE